jgi:hypothetical protein
MAASLYAAAPAAQASRSRLHLEPASAVPGQVITASAKGLSKKSKVKIGGKPAEVVSTKRGKLGIRVPDVRPGAAKVVVRSGGERLTGRLKVKKGFSGEVTPVLEPLNAISDDVGAAGGTVSATGSDGTRFDLTIPAGSLAATTTITMVPVASLGGLPGGEHALAVQLSPDGLTFTVPATLRVTPAQPVSSPVGIVYGGSGDKLTVKPVTQSGGSLLIEVRHFSGAGATPLSEQDFERLVAEISTYEMNLVEAGRFFSAYRAVPAAWCDANHPTCQTVKVDAANFVGGLTKDQCLEGVGSFLDLMLREVTLLLGVEADTIASGFSFPKLAECRQTLTTAMYDLTREPARDDALAFSNPCSGVSLANADYDGNGQNSNVECLLLVAAEADVQAFDGIANAARIVIEAALRKVLDEGNAKCDGTNYLDGQAVLEKGFAIARVSVLEAEFNNAITGCVPKIKVAPPHADLATGDQANFTATTNYLSPDIRWSATGGTIPNAGDTVQYTAPGQPGTYTVTATDFLIPGIQATATVTVTKIEVSISPTEAALLPGGISQFTATVTGTSDTRIDWSADCGTVDQAGLYTAPQTAGTCTVTAASHHDPSKKASAIVTVDPGTVSFSISESNPPIVHPEGETITWSTSATNTGPTTVSGVVLHAQIHAFPFPSNGVPGSCGSGGGALSFGAISPGQTVSGPMVTTTCTGDGPGLFDACLDGYLSPNPADPADFVARGCETVESSD